MNEKRPTVRGVPFFTWQEVPEAAGMGAATVRGPEPVPAAVPAPPNGVPFPRPVLCEMLVAAVSVPSSFAVPCTITDVPGLSSLTLPLVVTLTSVEASVVTLTTLPEKSST